MKGARILDKLQGDTLQTHSAEILRFLNEKKSSVSSLLILTHDYPDPDALASAFALYHLAREGYGISAKIVYGGIVGRTENRAMVSILKIPIHKIAENELKRAKHVALIDTQPGFDNNPFNKEVRALIVIDQHPPVRKPDAELAVIETECGATSVVLAHCLLQSGLSVPVNLATALTYGILSDTAHFFRCNDAQVIQTYLDILAHSDLGLLAKIQNPPRSRSFFTSLGKAFQNAVVFRKTIVSHLGVIDTPDLVAQTADFLMTYNKVSWSLCTGRYKHKLYVSLRGSKSDIPAYEILRAIVPDPSHAGGHDVIAGGSFEVEESGGGRAWEPAENLLVDKLRRRLKLSKVKTISDPFKLKDKSVAAGNLL